MTDIALSPVTDWAALGERWRALEARSRCSFFQSWTWTGCCAEERFPDPVLVEAVRDGRVVAMALFNRRRGRLGQQNLWLGESGTPSIDSVFVEWNGVLAESGGSPELLAECLRAARTASIGRERPRFPRRVVLSGIDETTLVAARLAGAGLFVGRSMAAPYVDLAGIRQAKQCYLEALSGNTRYQLRRSERAYEQTGELVLQRASSVDEAGEFLAELARLHQATWTRRGKPGAFASPWFLRFHDTLIQRGLPRGEIALLRLAAGGRTVGFLYNYEFRDAVLAYQSGFDYLGAGRHQVPGLTCHHQAIVDALARGFDRYDFLAGEDRYKRSLATSAARLHWAELTGGVPGRGMALRLRRWLADRISGSKRETHVTPLFASFLQPEVRS